MKKNKILVTGGCGFIGSHLTEYLVRKGYNVIVFDRYNTSNNYGWLQNSIYKKELIPNSLNDKVCINKAK